MSTPSGTPVMTVFDSRWGESKRAQQRNAAAAAPATLHSAPVETERRGAVHVYRVRFYATPSYSAQTVDWKRRVQDLVDDANAVLEPSLRMRLQVESCRESGLGQEDDLQDTLASLRGRDAGGDVDWVMGMVGALSRTTVSFHQLGFAEVGGKYLVVRAAGELEEHKAIEHNFDQLKEEDRAQLVRARKRHRTTAVFLHEMGHILGAPHVRDAKSFMVPEYDARMEAYDEASMLRMRASLEHREDVRPTPMAEAKLPQPSEPPAAPAPQEKPEPAEKAPPADIASLSERERSAYTKAMRAYEEGDAASAYTSGRALFEARKDVYAVQDLRCKVALARGLVWTDTRTECDALMKLSTSKQK
ncbi:matrixin family metalloprotease [Pendulispora rubella]|uniref:Matrixin family metalloprotease n=1 Tax=Pendulispora rubella TaxID=2741070 RepID=A0ABZ2KSY6_9BACT